VVQAEFETAAAAVLPAIPPATPVLGIDEIRRGKARFVADPATGQIRQVVDRWFTGFVDLTGRHGLLGQVEGRAAADVGEWLTAQTTAWREQVRVVAIDMCASYRAAIREHLPHATIVVDHFHLVQLANAKLAQVRRRVTATVRGRRARGDDPEYGIRRRLQRNYEDLKPGQFDDMFTRLDALGTPVEQIKIAYIAKEELRRLLHLARTDPCRHQISQQLYVFYSWCAEGDIGELTQLARTVDMWWPQIEAFLHTGITNAGSEATNRVSKLEGRNAYGFRNPDHQRLRCMVASTRRRRHINRTTSKTGQVR
jgi:transposase